jgi:hypothetical protein
MSRLSTSGPRDAGPIVATILVRLMSAFVRAQLRHPRGRRVDAKPRVAIGRSRFEVGLLLGQTAQAAFGQGVLAPVFRSGHADTEARARTGPRFRELKRSTNNTCSLIHDRYKGAHGVLASDGGVIVSLRPLLPAICLVAVSRCASGHSVSARCVGRPLGLRHDGKEASRSVP